MSKPSDQIDTFQEERLQNKTATYYEDTRITSQSTCNSVYVTRGEWLLYSETGYKGSCVQLPLTINYLDRNKYDTVEAIGEYLIGYQETSESAKAPWGDRVSSLRPINQADCLTIYSDINLSSGQQEYREEFRGVVHISSLVVRGKYAWELYPTGNPNSGYEWNDNKPLTVYPGKEHDILDVTKIPGYPDKNELFTAGLFKPVTPPSPSPGKN